MASFLFAGKHLQNIIKFILTTFILNNFMPISDSEIFVALFVALLTGILAVRLGIELYRPITR